MFNLCQRTNSNILLEVQLYKFPEIYLIRTQRILHPIQEEWSQTNRDIKEHCLFDSENDSMVI